MSKLLLTLLLLTGAARADAPAGLAQQVTPSVVHLRVVKVTPNPKTDMEKIVGKSWVLSVLDRFFPTSEMQKPKMGIGTGAGFVIRHDGLILTNQHVIEDVASVRVTLADGREYQGQIVGADAATDVALVKIDATGLPALPPANLDQTKVGDSVMVIGSPRGYDRTVTAGTIGALRRVVDEPFDYIQFDAKVTHGNSGGAVVNNKGQVLGMTARGYADTPLIGLAIPIDRALYVAGQILDAGGVRRGRLGVEVQEMNAGLRSGLGAPVGVLVANVTRFGAGAVAGIQSGDVIESAGGKPMKRPADLAEVLLYSPDRLTLSLWRNGQRHTIEARPEVTVGQFERPEKLAIGLQFEERANVVEVVDVSGVAESNGIKKGDKVRTINNRPATAAALNATLQAGQPAALGIERDGVHMFVDL